MTEPMPYGWGEPFRKNIDNRHFAEHIKAYRKSRMYLERNRPKREKRKKGAALKDWGLDEPFVGWERTRTFETTEIAELESIAIRSATRYGEFARKWGKRVRISKQGRDVSVWIEGGS